MKIELWFESKDRILSATVKDKVVKAYCNITFLEENKKWSKIYNAIIDTASHTTLIPEYIWRNLNFEYLSESLFLGVKSNLLCSVPCKVARIFATLLDENGNVSKPFIMNAYLAKNNDVPLIIGVSTALEQFNLYLDYKNKKGYLESNEA